MSESIRPAAAALAVLMGLAGCRGRDATRDSVAAVAQAGEVTNPCAGDSLRPATAAPAAGLWMNEGASGQRVAAMIGPQRADDRSLAVARPVETVEVSNAGDTIRHVASAATVSLELLPPLGTVAIRGTAQAGSTIGQQPAATYAVSPRVRLAAYESCAPSPRSPRIRYLRRDGAGKIATDVLLRRTSDQ